jgi:hypothetical protein
VTDRQRADKLRTFIKEVDDAKTMDEVMVLLERMNLMMCTYDTPEDLR